MGISKTILFTEEQNQMATMAKALAHPARIAILEHLINKADCANTYLVDEIGLAQSTISQHLKALKEAGLIQGNIAGNSMCYCIDPESWKKLKTNLNQLLDQFNLKNCC